MLFIFKQVSRMWRRQTADGVPGEIAAAAATAVHSFANFVLDQCKLTHARAYLHGFANSGNGAGLFYARISGPVSSGRHANAGVANTQSRRLFKEDADQIKKGGTVTNFKIN